MSNLDECLKYLKNIEKSVEEFYILDVNPEKLFEKCEIIKKSVQVILSGDLVPFCHHQRAQSIITRVETCMIKILNYLTKHGGSLKQNQGNTVQWIDVASAFKNRIKTGAIVNLSHKDINKFFTDAKKLFMLKIKDSLKENKSIKVNTNLLTKFKKYSNNEEILDMKNFSTKNVEILQSTDLKNWFNENVKESINKKIDEFQDGSSGWTIQSIINLEVNINKFNPLRGNSYIELPLWIKKKNACINVENFNDKKCFMWSILSALYPQKKNSCRVSKYIPYENELNFNGIDDAVSLAQIPRFEKLNQISINVYGLEFLKNKYEVYPLYLTSDYKKRHVNLLLIEKNYSNTDSIDLKFHYVWIKDLSRLIKSQVTKHHDKLHVCDRCLHFFYSKEKLNNHFEECKKINNCKIRLPNPENSTVRFKNYKNKLTVPFVIYADCECLLLPVKDNNILENNTQVLQKHEIFSIGYYLKCSYDESLSRYNSYRGLNATKWFAKELENISFEVQKIHTSYKKWMTLPSKKNMNLKLLQNVTYVKIVLVKIKQNTEIIVI